MMMRITVGRRNEEPKKIAGEEEDEEDTEEAKKSRSFLEIIFICNRFNCLLMICEFNCLSM